MIDLLVFICELIVYNYIKQKKTMGPFFPLSTLFFKFLLFLFLLYYIVKIIFVHCYIKMHTE